MFRIPFKRLKQGTFKIMEDSEQLENSDTQRESTSENHNKNDTISPIPSVETQNTHIFSCIPCAMRFIDHIEFTMHIRSDDHAGMILATGFEEHSTENCSDIFPPLYCCVLCDVWSFDSNTFVGHLKGKTHKKRANFMRSDSKKQSVVGSICSCESSVLSDPYYPLHYCEYCDIWCISCKSFDQHEKRKNHKKIKQFIIRMSNSAAVKPDSYKYTGEKVSEKDSDCQAQNYFCNLCNIKFKEHESYENHVKGRIHKKFHQLITKMLDGKDENETSVCFNASMSFKNSLSLLKYCEFCHTWFKNSKHYDSHLKTILHVKLKMSNRSNNNADGAFKEQSADELLFDSFTLAFFCESCNIRFSESDSFDDHLRSAIHKRIEQFISKMTNSKKRNSASDSSDASKLKNAGSSRPLLHYCELCNIWCYDRNIDHFQYKIHKIMETYVSKISFKNVKLCENGQSSRCQYFNCELCDIQFKKPISYKQHLQGKIHKKVEHLVDRLSNKTEKKLNHVNFGREKVN